MSYGLHSQVSFAACLTNLEFYEMVVLECMASEFNMVLRLHIYEKMLQESMPLYFFYSVYQERLIDHVDAGFMVSKRQEGFFND